MIPPRGSRPSSARKKTSSVGVHRLVPSTTTYRPPSVPKDGHSSTSGLRGQYARLLDAYTMLVMKCHRMELALETKDHEVTGMESSLRRRWDDK